MTNLQTILSRLGTCWTRGLAERYEEEVRALDETTLAALSAAHAATAPNRPMVARLLRVA